MSIQNKKVIKLLGIPLCTKSMNGDTTEYRILGIPILKHIRDVTGIQRYVFGFCYRHKKVALQWKIARSLGYVKRCEVSPRECLIVACAAIGDYILTRNFFEDLKESARFRGYRFALLCDEQVRDIAESLDSEFFYKIISFGEKIHPQKEPDLRVVERIRRKCIQKGLKKCYDTILLPYTIFPFKPFLKAYEHLLSSVTSRERIALAYVPSKGNGSDYLHYTHVVPFYERGGRRFCFNVFKDYFSAVIGEEIPRTFPSIDTEKIPDWDKGSTPYAVFQPFCSSAAGKIKMWHLNNWVELLREYRQYRSEKIYLLCADNEKSSARILEKELRTGGVDVELITGLSMRKILSFIKSASLYVGLDSGLFHIAAALGVNTVCISSGRSYLPFLSGYIRSQRENVRILLPKGWEEWRDNNDRIIDETGYGGMLLINSVREKDVLKATLNMVQRSTSIHHGDEVEGNTSLTE